MDVRNDSLKSAIIAQSKEKHVSLAESGPQSGGQGFIAAWLVMTVRAAHGLNASFEMRQNVVVEPPFMLHCRSVRIEQK